ncbi:hypothetical protein FIV42_25095 [Persicimonas caeni]|uniref:DUF1772 domain-containing protein n=2 Tax=Persicimonas caeni TaxID=2292766 RepID=A0A4Y6Q323_PERCE|nr:hypothetical protein FIV42_25095 [Persicimonas caeni]QED36185.1 hypothetical protein FRD00_25090 [Persicimonas caeni]
MTLLELTQLAHVAATLYMVGLIWFVQIVHYPGFALVGGDAFVPYTREHVRRTGWVVGPPMLLEAATAVLLVVLLPTSPLAWTGLGLLALIWASTALLQVPAHSRLNEAHDAPIIDRLVRTNWLRTTAWTTRGLLALALLI